MPGRCTLTVTLIIRPTGKIGRVSETAFAAASATHVRHVGLRALKWCALHGNRLGVIPVIVYQMAKVGSSSVADALRNARLPVFHVHRMNAAHLSHMRDRRRTLGWAVGEVPPHDRLGIRIGRKLMDHGIRAAIVTLVWDPIARNISSYFEHLDAIWQTPNAHECVSMTRLIDGFHRQFPHEEPLTWFADEMLPVTGIDVYEHPFPSSGHVVIVKRNIELLILKSELPDASKALAISGFVGHPGLTITPANRTESKAKGAVYRQFVEQVRFSRSYIEKLLASKYVRHFYSRNEVETLWERYSG